MYQRSVVSNYFIIPLLLLFAFSKSQAQISFGGGGSNPSNSQGGSSNLFNILNRSSVSLSTRNGINPSTRNAGSRCFTPRGEPGVCSFISDSRCGDVLRAIQRVGITQQVINYLRRAIQPPCGFDRFDYTLCCRDAGGPVSTSAPLSSSSTTTRSTTISTTKSTTTSTTTQSPAINICGITGFKTRVTGGQVALPGVWPWAVILGQRRGGGGIEVICGGTLISDRHVLTAAHCFRGQRSINVARLGEHDITTDADGANPQDFSLRDVNVHTGYNGVDLKNDIAIVTLASPAVFSSRIRPACLPKENNPFPNGEAVIIGWGATRTGGGTVTQLRQANVPIISISECDQFYSGINRVSIDGRQLCGRPGPIDSCSGDSGGPMLTDKTNNRWTVIGITSFGVECARDGFPGVYTNVQAYLSWINERI